MGELSGVICATLTPFVSHVGPVDYEWIGPHLRFLERNGVAGIVPLGTTGESASLGLGERERVLDAVLAEKGDLFVIAGTGSSALTETITFSRYALEQGADAVLLLPPFYFKGLSDEGVLSYFRAVCDALPKDARVLLYHIPRNTGVAITPIVIDGLLESHGRQFFGIKDSSGDADHTADLIRRYPQLRMYSGSDAHVASSLASGANGVISALANVFPQLVRTVYDAHEQGGDSDAAQRRLLSARTLVKHYATPPALKAAMALATGLPVTSVRTPLTNLSPEQSELLQQELVNAGLVG